MTETIATPNDLYFAYIPNNGGKSIIEFGESREIDWGFNYIKKHKMSLWDSPYFMNTYPKRLSDCFTIVRDPYERLIHAYKSMFKNNKNDLNSVKKFNDWILKNVLAIQELLSNVNSNIDKYKNFVNINILPQFLFTHDLNDNMVVFHILRYENMNDDFKHLMIEYNSDIEYHLIDEDEPLEDITKQWFSQENILLINKVYHKDFMFFHYPKMLDDN